MPEQSTMLPNAFIGSLAAPSAEELAAVLGAAKPHWERLLARLASECNLTEGEWHSYSPKAGWALRLKAKKRNIVYLAPCRSAFRVMFILGDRAVRAARQSTLPRAVVQLVEKGKRYPEGTAVRFEMTGGNHIPAIVKLAGIKLRY
jgi:hypothetical protein